MSVLDLVLDAGFAFAVLRAASPILLAAMGGVLTERAGVPNIGVEGMMLTGAFVAVVTTLATGSPWVGLGAAVLAAAVAGALLAWVAVDLHADIIVAGFAINTLVGGSTLFAMSELYGTRGSIVDSSLVTLPRIDLPIVASVPVLGEAVSGHNVLVYVGWLSVLAVAVVLRRTRTGVHLRAVGASPETAAAVGIDTRRVQYGTLVVAGALAGLGGANLSIGYLSSFTRDMTAGRGFIALAAVLFAGARPGLTVVATLVFGIADALGNVLQRTDVPSQALLMLPYLATFLAITVHSIRTSRRQGSPAPTTTPEATS
ncbi:ABC transporter permease [Euzebya rosea]|uniref:ABC transporter permease n=1 Tax=Euzebya rosea TaxID=2052804 RepID=UPI001300BEC8|nr:ABC transporter permease [Euzebya rosea]